jgi:hypothetical protein
MNEKKKYVTTQPSRGAAPRYQMVETGIVNRLFLTMQSNIKSNIDKKSVLDLM